MNANYAGEIALLLNDILSTSTEENLRIRSEEEYKATEDKLKLAKKSKRLGYDVIYKDLSQMYKEETLHSKIL